MTAPVLAAREGRPSIDGVRHSLELARRANADLRTELRAQKLASAEYAVQVRRRAAAIKHAVVAELDLVAYQHAIAIEETSTRHLASLSSSVL